MFGLSSLLLAALIISTDVVEQQTANTTPVTEQETTATQENTTSVSPEDAVETKKQPITIINAIEPSMLTYKHWTGTYSPELFTITVNGTQVASQETYTLESADTPLVVQFDYSFMNGIRKGSKKISYQMNAECTNAKMTFSWLDSWHITIDNATPITVEIIS